MIRALALVALVCALPAAVQGGAYYRPRTIIATPFSYGGVTVYRGMNGRSLGTSMPMSNGIRIYRGR